MPENQNPLGDWIDMNLKLLDIERSEVRHWQNIVPNLTFWILAGIFGLTAFFMTRPPDPPPTQALWFGIIISATIAALTLSYCLIASWLKRFIEMIHEGNLRKVEGNLKECASRLGEKGEFPYDDKGERVKQQYIGWLRAVVCIFGTSAALFVLVWCIARYCQATKAVTAFVP